jgi:hypothetical protein
LLNKLNQAGKLAAAISKTQSNSGNLKKSARYLAISAAALLVACGGGQETNQTDVLAQDQASTELATGITNFEINLPAETAPEQDVSNLVAKPLFHAAAGRLSEPDDIDAFSSDFSARKGPRKYRLDANSNDIPTRRLTPQDMKGPVLDETSTDLTPNPTSSDQVAPLAAGGIVTTYTPAQIRAAYKLPPLPVSLTNLTADQAAQLGAGQTIYIVNAMHNPNTLAELSAFNQKFGLPTCTAKAIPVTAALPLPPASKTGCEISIVYSTPSNTMTATAPAYESGWATEIALDVQWAHATAPMARIVVIEAPDAYINSLVGGIKLANAMGPGIVSMSFGALEGNWTASVDSAFTGANMSYLAATGDSGAAVSWPSVSNNVLAVGGTTLNYTGTGTRSETSWSGTGGGTSAYTQTPAYQNNTVPGMGSVARRTVADVAFNADPNSGQYVAVMTPGNATVNWISAGGTSLSTPQWAGLLAIANASRALTAKAPVGLAHPLLYGQISTTPGTYASTFADITQGAHGSCATCSAKIGYDALSGLGTPNVTSLVTTLSGAASPAVAPVVPNANISGKVGTTLSFTVAASSPNPVTYTLSGAPAGMTINASGVVLWATPVAGTYRVTVNAKDTKTNLSGSGVATITVAAAPAPTVASGSFAGKVNVALSFPVTVTSQNPVTYTLSGAPAGMTISASGLVSWTKPTAGTFKVTVSAKDTKTSATGSGVYTVSIATPLPPTVSTTTINGKPGVAINYGNIASSPNPATYTLTGAPAGLSINSSGVISWPNPVVGNFPVTVTAKDSVTGLSGKGVITFKISQAGPVIASKIITGTAGTALKAAINVSAPGSSYVSISVAGAPLGMGLSLSGASNTSTASINIYWPKPVAGTYNLKVTAVDSANLSAAVTIPVIIK